MVRDRASPSARAGAAPRVPRLNFLLLPAPNAGVRTPFVTSGGPFKDLIAVELARAALCGLVARTAVDTSRLDTVVLGTVIQEGEWREQA